MFHGPIRDRLALTRILLAPGGWKLSFETAKFCAELLAMPDPKEAAIARAKELGTLNKVDRSVQYQGRYSNEILKRNDDLLFQKLREFEDREFRHKMILLALSWAPGIAAFVYAWLK